MQIHTQLIFNLARIAGACLNIQEGLEKILNKLLINVLDYKVFYIKYIRRSSKMTIITPPPPPPPPPPFQARVPPVNLGHFHHCVNLVCF